MVCHDRIPSGTRDVLPDEMRELRAITDGSAACSSAVDMARSTRRRSSTSGPSSARHAARRAPVYRLFDEHGDVLVLRSDMTVPIARLAATATRQRRPPLRFSYVAHAYRPVRPKRGQSREFMQAGIELIGEPAPTGTAEALTVLCDALAAAGLESFRIGLGDVSLYPGAAGGARSARASTPRGILAALVPRDFVGIERELPTPA